MNFSLFSFNPSSKKTDKPQEVICIRKISKWTVFFKVIEAIAALAVAVCAIGGIVISSKNYNLAVNNLNYCTEINGFLTRPIPVIEIIKDADFRVAVINRGIRPIRSVKTAFKIFYENDGIQRESDGVNYQEILEKDRAAAFSIAAAYNDLLANIKTPSAGFIFVVVAMNSPSIDQHAVKVLYRNLAEPERWYEADPTLWTLSPIHQKLIAKQIEELKKTSENPRYVYSV